MEKMLIITVTVDDDKTGALHSFVSCVPKAYCNQKETNSGVTLFIHTPIMYTRNILYAIDLLER